MTGVSSGDLGAPLLRRFWPGYGVRIAGWHMGETTEGARASIHTHPGSGERLFKWIGDGEDYIEGKWMPSSAYNVLLAPCGVHHSVGRSRNLGDRPNDGCGLASPPAARSLH